MFSAGTAPVRSLPELTEHFVQSPGLCRRDLSHLLLDHDGISDRLILHLVVDASSVQGIAYDVLPLEGESAFSHKLPEALNIFPDAFVPRREKDVLQLCQPSRVRDHRIFIGRQRSFLAPEIVLHIALVFPGWRRSDRHREIDGFAERLCTRQILRALGLHSSHSTLPMSHSLLRGLAAV